MINSALKLVSNIPKNFCLFPTRNCYSSFQNLKSMFYKQSIFNGLIRRKDKLGDRGGSSSANEICRLSTV